jgi:hypothetical protein
VPNRILKESICTSDSINHLSLFEEVFFYRLIVNCDDYGRMDARPAILKAKLFPLRDVRTEQIGEALNSLSSEELVEVYDVDAKPFVRLVGWAKHQRVRNSVERYPAPDTSTRGNSRQLAATCGNSRPESNPIRIQSEAESTRDGCFVTDAEVGTMVQEAQRLSRVCDAAEHAGFPHTQADLDRLTMIVSEYGAEAVQNAIGRAVDQGESKRTWAYVRGILKSDPTGGTRGKPKTREPQMPPDFEGE